MYSELPGVTRSALLPRRSAVQLECLATSLRNTAQFRYVQTEYNKALFRRLRPLTAGATDKLSDVVFRDACDASQYQDLQREIAASGSPEAPGIPHFDHNHHYVEFALAPAHLRALERTDRVYGFRARYRLRLQEVFAQKLRERPQPNARAVPLRHFDALYRAGTAFFVEAGADGFCVLRTKMGRPAGALLYTNRRGYYRAGQPRLEPLAGADQVALQALLALVLNHEGEERYLVCGGRRLGELVHTLGRGACCGLARQLQAFLGARELLLVACDEPVYLEQRACRLYTELLGEQDE